MTEDKVRGEKERLFKPYLKTLTFLGTIVLKEVNLKARDSVEPVYSHVRERQLNALEEKGRVAATYAKQTRFRRT